MSYIYEALKKAEDEHKRGAVAVRAMGRRTLFSGKPPWWLWVLVGVLGANVLVLATLAFTVGSRWPGSGGAGRQPAVTSAREPDATRAQSTGAPSAEAVKPGDGAARVSPVTPPVTAAPPVASTPPATTTPPVGAAARVATGPAVPAPVAPSVPGRSSTSATPAPAPAPTTPSAPVTPSTAGTSSTPAPSPTPGASAPSAAPFATARPAIPPPVAAPLPATATPAPHGDATASRGRRAEARAAPSRVERPAAQPSSRAQEPTSPQSAAAPTAPAPQETHPSVADARPAESGAPVEAPKATLQVIVYSDVPSQRMVFIDGQRYGEGDALDAETVIERINSDGVVVKRRGVRFVIAGNRN